MTQENKHLGVSKQPQDSNTQSFFGGERSSWEMIMKTDECFGEYQWPLDSYCYLKFLVQFTEISNILNLDVLAFRGMGKD